MERVVRSDLPLHVSGVHVVNLILAVEMDGNPLSMLCCITSFLFSLNVELH